MHYAMHYGMHDAMHYVMHYAMHDAGTRYTFCDDPSNFYSWPRELGAVVVSAENLVVLLPRVRRRSCCEL